MQQIFDKLIELHGELNRIITYSARAAEHSNIRQPNQVRLSVFRAVREGRDLSQKLMVFCNSCSTPISESERVKVSEMVAMIEKWIIRANVELCLALKDWEQRRFYAIANQAGRITLYKHRERINNIFERMERSLLSITENSSKLYTAGGLSAVTKRFEVLQTSIAQLDRLLTRMEALLHSNSLERSRLANVAVLGMVGSLLAVHFFLIFAIMSAIR